MGLLIALLSLSVFLWRMRVRRRRKGFSDEWWSSVGRQSSRVEYHGVLDSQAMEMTPISPVQLCACGCGNPSGVYQTTKKAFGRTKGQPRRLLPGGHRPCNSAPYHRTRVDGRCRPLHVAIAEKALGKTLPAGVEVHHVDGNKRNNDNSNLVVCQDRAYHRLLHVRQRVVDMGGNPNTQRICFKCQQPKLAHELVGATLESKECKKCCSSRCLARYHEARKRSQP